jgi:hypothetical protein
VKHKCLLTRDILIHHGVHAVRVTQDIEAEIDFPDGIDVANGVWQDKETRGEWRVIRTTQREKGK